MDLDFGGMLGVVNYRQIPQEFGYFIPDFNVGCGYEDYRIMFDNKEIRRGDWIFLQKNLEELIILEVVDNNNILFKNSIIPVEEALKEYIFGTINVETQNDYMGLFDKIVN